ncbi:HDOD domain-containing protein [Spiribacter halobius]|uniref:HDOD domain-containing protein n=1 Tax=Sediminicurvatus halobius TaxID=2182432 RepID=A0A2U2N8C6_9GAMM|nr:HDOD domain-containing protein [Spiribacter halobius]PWG65370.1 hypothetical protein DEM34_01070 [Spiribacter halobius]UEX76386.1 HDOD domain-containing protein [Spiribacter halobius]
MTTTGVQTTEDWCRALDRATGCGDVPLPGLPEMALRVRQAASAENASSDALARLIGQDAAMSTRLMKVANAAAARRAAPARSLDRAIARIGFGLTCSLVTGLCILRQMERYRGDVAARLRAHHEASVAVAAIAHYLARQARGVDPHEAMLAGLLHDIGVLPILDFAARNPALAADGAALDALIERRRAPLGAAVLDQWHFPPSLVGVAAGLDQLDREHEGGTDLLDVILAARLEHARGTRAIELERPVMARFDLIEAPLAERAEAQAEIRALRGALAG